MSEHPDSALVRRGYDAFNNGDMATLRTLLTADCIHHIPGSSRLSGHYKGQDNILEMYGERMELAGGSLRVELHGAYPDGRGHVMAVHKYYAEHGDRGIEMPGGLWFTIVGGKITDIDECVQDIDETDAFWGPAG
ncbi:nuclear transport factor 2 family protein [Streptomyces sp. NPDC055709]